MQLTDFDYELPRERIAQEPAPRRDESRLMVLHRDDGRIEHRTFRDLPGYFESGDHLVINDTRVVPSRLFGHREGAEGKIEVLLLNPFRGRAGHPTFVALARPARKLVAGTALILGDRSTTRAVVIREIDDRTRLVEFEENFEVLDFLEENGHVPLPPYIQRPDGPEDRERYQTIFARQPGAVAAPTAGLHFTEEIRAALSERKVGLSPVTLHVGAGTFSPILEEDPREHVMDREYYRIPPETADAIAAVRSGGGRLTAVGTTVVRTLETAAETRPDGTWTAHPGDGWTEKFIYPPYSFRLVDRMITNFHLPRSTLLMLVCAFAGTERVRRAYREAVHQEYRFYSYGDAMLIL